MDVENVPMPESGRFLSVIVPVRDDPDGIDALLQRLEAQTLPAERFEVVIGDDGSWPPLPTAASTNANARIEAGPPRASYAARNRAVRASRGTILAFCDSDCLPEPTWLEEGVEALEEAELVAGEVTFVPPLRPTVWSLLTIDMFLDQERNVQLCQAVTANLFMTRAVFESAGGFDESLPSGGDYDLVRRCVAQGARLVYAPKAVVHHPTLDNRRAFLGKVWATNRWWGVRRTRGHGAPAAREFPTFIPFLGVALARRRALRPAAGLHRKRLAAAGVRSGLRNDIRALPVLYLVVATVAALGRLTGWCDAVSSRVAGPSWNRNPSSDRGNLTSRS